MNATNQQISRLMVTCKSELLNHTLQNDVVSTHIKKINLCLDECLALLDENFKMPLRKRKNRSSRGDGEEKNRILFFAYCMSRWDYQFVNLLTGGNFNQTEAFDYLAKKINVKENTIRNYRDTFDSHVEQKRSKRQGWKKELTPDFVRILEQYDSFAEQDLLEVAEGIFKSM